MAKQCPQCKGPLERVTYPSNCMLNYEQWEATIAGNWCCETCPDNGRGKSGKCYWWDEDLLPGEKKEEVMSSAKKPFLEEDAKIIAAATSGPWRLREHIGVHVVGPSGHGAMIAVFDRSMDIGADSPTGWEGKIEDARFMAQARNKWPDHLAALQRIRKLIDIEDKQAATELIRNILEEL